jgi:hypothetical protein
MLQVVAIEFHHRDELSASGNPTEEITGAPLPKVLYVGSYSGQ